MPRGWQANLARYCKVKPPSVAGWLSEKSKSLEGENLLSAAAFFNVNPHWLATGSGEKNIDTLLEENIKDRIRLMNNPFAERIRASRIAVGLTQIALGDIVGLDQTVISKLERGTMHETTKIAELARALKVDAYWLATGNGTKESSTTIITVRDPVLDDLDALLPEDAEVWRVQIRAAAIKARRTPS